MSSDILDTLPLPQRLALSYSPGASRTDTLALLALDARLAGIVRGDGEVIIGQMKLAWWRDRLRQDPQEWPVGEPLLALLRSGQLEPSRLIPLVDGWESLFSETLDRAAIEAFAAGKARLWETLANAHSGEPTPAVSQAAREQGMAELALNLGSEHETALAVETAREQPWKSARLPRALRPLAILHGLSRRAMDRGSPDLLDGPGAMAMVLRIGLTGR